MDILIGIPDFNICVSKESHLLRLFNTPFGWSVSGSIPADDMALSLSISITPDNLQSDLSKLCELDQVPEAPSNTPDDDTTIEEFVNSHSRVDGRFMVKLPRLPDPPTLDNSRGQALRRLLVNEKTLTKKGRLEDFQKVLHEYLTLGHAKVVPRNQLKITTYQYTLYSKILCLPPSCVRCLTPRPAPLLASH